MIQQCRRTLVVAAIVCLILAGCERKATEGNKAAGEVLEGTISDSMIATDKSRAAPPIAPRKDTAPDAKGSKAKAKPGGDAALVESPTPETSATAEASPAPKSTASEPAA